MPRGMPRLADDFCDSSAIAVGFAGAVENARISLGVKEAQRHLPVAKLELAYELAYLRVFTAWEDFLEQSFLRYLCGYMASHGQERLLVGRYYQNLTQAKTALYGQ